MFGGGFKASKCKTLLRLAMARIKLLRNKRDIQVKQMRKDIAQLLSTGQEPSARIRVEHISREQNIMAAYDIIELFCELVIVRLPIIESQKVCPMDLKEAVSSLIFASPRCADLPELLQIRGLFSSKYGKEFVAAAAELRPECGVNRRIIEKLSVRAPSGPMKLKLLKEIADEHNVSWDPANSEAELLKQPEDLLDGPKNFFGASQAPIEFLPFPSKPEEPVSHPQKTSTVPPLAPVSPAPPAPSVPPPSATSETKEDTPLQFIPFVGTLPPKGTPATKGSPSIAKGINSGKHESPDSSSTGDPYARAGKEGPMDSDEQGGYVNIAAAAIAAQQNADRAVAAARAAAELARTHPSKRESLSRRASDDILSSDSEEDSEEEELVVETKSSSRSKHEPLQQDKNASSAKTNDSQYHQAEADEFYRSNSDDRQEGPFRSSTSDKKQEGAFRKSSEEDESGNFSKWNYPEDRLDVNSSRRVDPEQETFWRSGDQDWQHGTSLRPEKNTASGGLFSSRSDGNESLYRSNSDLFNVGDSDELFASKPKDKDPYSSSSKIFSSSDSASNLFKRRNSEELELRSSDETPFYDSKQAFVTPKFDEEELPYRKPPSFMADYSAKRGFDNQRSDFAMPRMTTSSEIWRNSSSSPHDEEEVTPRNYSSFDNDDHHPQKQRSGAYNSFDSHLDDSQSLSRGNSDSVPSGIVHNRANDAETSPKYEDQRVSSPIPTKSRRTRNVGKGREKLERAGGSAGSGGNGGSGSLPLPPGKYSKFSGSENAEMAGSPDYHNPGEPENPSVHLYDDSPNFPSRTSLSFYNTSSKASAPPEHPPPILPPKQTPDSVRDSSPSVGASSHSSPGLERKESPLVHPKLPDYDDLSARFEALKGKGRTKR